MGNRKQNVGKRGEDEACNYLTGLGHKIVQRNWRSGHLELDIISLSNNALHIVEVKTGSGGTSVDPLYRVGREKQRRLIRAANAFLHSPMRAYLPADLDVYFDIISVVFEVPGPIIEYYPQAFIPIYY